MKKYFSYALVGAIALTGAVGFSSCSSSSDEVVGNNPSYNSEQSSVKTQFTISFPSNVARANTRQSGSTVQSAENIGSFRGMDNIVLLPFGATGNAGIEPISTSSTKLSNAIELTNIIVPNIGSVSNSIPASTLQGGSNSVLYNDVTIPVGTGSFLFYGKAIDANGGNFVNGSLAMTGDEPSSITFTPVQTNKNSTVSATGEHLAYYLTQIAQATNWAGCADEENIGKSWYNVGLGDLYTKFTSLKTGSSLDVQAAIEDLYGTIKNNTDAVSTAIKSRILNTEVRNSTDNEKYASVSGTTLSFSDKLGNGFTTAGGKTLYFPFDVNLPDGAALLQYAEDTSDHKMKFTQVTDGVSNTNTGITSTVTPGVTETIAYDDFVYPASLYYYCNSGITTSASSKKTLYESTTTNWETLTGTTNYEAGPSVRTSTRSVAILDPIQYAVGRLDMTIKTADNTLYDKNGDAYDASEGFTVTGVLIGGQKAVGFDFIPNGTKLWTIYDNIQKSQTSTLTATTTASPVNYTLALETAANTSVYVAVELINDGEDFQGADGVVPHGCKFYLVAELNPSADNTTEGSKVTSSGSTGHKVFKQDFKTFANFTIVAGSSGSTSNTKGLAAAYNTIPDLRTPQLELGLSVDLTWQPGVQFDLDL